MVSLYRRMLWQGTRSFLSLFCRTPWQRTSPVTTLCFAVMALESSPLKSKSPPTQSPLRQLKQKMDLACSRFALYFIPPLRVMPEASMYYKSTRSDFNFGKLSARLAELLIRSLCSKRYSIRGFVFLG